MPVEDGKSMGFGFIEFSTRASCAKAKDSMNGYETKGMSFDIFLSDEYTDDWELSTKYEAYTDQKKSSDCTW